MIREMDESDFAAFVADIWEQQGWNTQVTEKSGKAFVALQRDGAEGLIWATTGSSGDVSGKALQQFVQTAQEYGLDEGAVVTAGQFSDDAERIADQAGVDLVDGEKLRTIVEARELHDLVEKYGGGSGSGGGGGGDGDDDGPGLLDRLPVDDLPDVSAKAVGGVVVVAVLAVVAFVVVGPTILGTGGNVQEQSFNVTSTSSVSGNETKALDVTWNARTTTELEPEKNVVYQARDGQQFVVVQLNVTNTGQGTVGLRQEGFRLRANGTVHGHQPLTNASGFEVGVLEPGKSMSTWTVFSVDEGVANATLVADGGVYGDVAVRFQRDADLEVGA
ncbi:restriction endonuclease [Halomicrococcus gelatinilyticus]|uniref:restriction endonuclease n=1 Tax=Halomicrococcus gelatinilyticus TaxID=1702103 RepID=UPI002E14533C